MTDATESGATPDAAADRADDDPGGEGDDPDEPRTSGHVERAVLGRMLGDDGRRPVTVGDVLPAVAAVVERGDYGNPGPRSSETVVRKSSVRRTFGQLERKGLVCRAEDLDPAALRSDRYDLGDLEGEDPTDPASYARVSADGRVTDWLLTDAGRRELDRLDARYAAELDDLAARYGRPPGETTARVDPSGDRSRTGRRQSAGGDGETELSVDR